MLRIMHLKVLISLEQGSLGASIEHKWEIANVEICDVTASSFGYYPVNIGLWKLDILSYFRNTEVFVTDFVMVDIDSVG